MAYNEKELKQFLREQGLTTTYRRWKKHRPKVRRKLEVYTSDYQGGRQRRQLLFFKEKGKTIIRDGRTYEVIARSIRSIPQTIKILPEKRRSNRKITVVDSTNADHRARGWDVTDKTARSRLSIKNESVKYSYNKIEGIYTKIVSTNRIKRDRVGYVTITARYYNSSGSSVIITRNSRYQYLDTAAKRQRAISEAIDLGAVLAGFSPVAVDLLDYHYNFGYSSRVKPGRNI